MIYDSFLFALAYCVVTLVAVRSSPTIPAECTPGQRAFWRGVFGGLFVLAFVGAAWIIMDIINFFVFIWTAT